MTVLVDKNTNKAFFINFIVPTIQPNVYFWQNHWLNFIYTFKLKLDWLFMSLATLATITKTAYTYMFPLNSSSGAYPVWMSRRPFWLTQFYLPQLEKIMWSWTMFSSFLARIFSSNRSPFTWNFFEVSLATNHIFSGFSLSRPSIWSLLLQFSSVQKICSFCGGPHNLTHGPPKVSSKSCDGATSRTRLFFWWLLGTRFMILLHIADQRRRSSEKVSLLYIM